MARRLQLSRSTFELLFRAARMVNERAVAEIQREGQRDRKARLRLAHTQLFPHITFEGVRLTDVAKRLQVTKQAISPLVDELVEAGMVERIADPADQRAKLIRWTKEGGLALQHGLGVLGQLERELAPVVGATRMAALADTLEALIAALGGLQPVAAPKAIERNRRPGVDHSDQPRRRSGK